MLNDPLQGIRSVTGVSPTNALRANLNSGATKNFTKQDLAGIRRTFYVVGAEPMVFENLQQLVLYSDGTMQLVLDDNTSETLAPVWWRYRAEKTATAPNTI